LIDGRYLFSLYAEGMLDYARERAKEVLCIPSTVVLATCGPAGVLVGEFPCEAVGLDLFLLVPKTSDHLFNLEHSSNVGLLCNTWELRGKAGLDADALSKVQRLGQEPGAEWCTLVGVIPRVLYIHGEKGETIDLEQKKE